MLPTEQLEIIPARVARFRPPTLVEWLTGAVLAGSWCATCLAVIPWR